MSGFSQRAGLSDTPVENSLIEQFSDLGVEATNPNLDNKSKSFNNSDFHRKVGLVDESLNGMETTPTPVQVFVLPPQAYHVGRLFSVEQFLKLGRNRTKGSTNQTNVKSQTM